jgi:hypothetical protein
MEVVELFYGEIPFDIPTYSCRAKSRRPNRIASHRQTERKITEGEVPMIIRVLITAMALLLAGYAFWDGALSGGHVLNPFGIMFLFLSGAVWLGWKPIREIFRSTRDESVIPTIVKGMGKRAPPPRQSSSS